MRGSLGQISNRVAVAVLPIVLAMAAATGCGSDGDGDSATTGNAQVDPPSSIADAGQIVYCSDLTFPPQEFVENGEQVGSDVEIGKELARLMGVDAVYQQVGFDGIIAALLGEKCDAINSGMTDTPERRQQVAFAHYAQVGEQLMVQKGNPENIQGLDDLSGRSIAVQIGTAPRDRLDAENDTLASEGKPEIDIVTFQTDGDAANALKTGKVDAYISDSTPVAYYIQTNPDDFEAGGPQFEPHPIGLALRQDDVELQQALDEAIALMYEQGSIQKILEEWNIEGTALE